MKMIDIPFSWAFAECTLEKKIAKTDSVHCHLRVLHLLDPTRAGGTFACTHVSRRPATFTLPMGDSMPFLLTLGGMHHSYSMST